MANRVSRLLPPQAEFNVTQLGLIALQSRLPKEFIHSWEHRIGTPETGKSVSCSTSYSHGVPHGIAADLFLGIATSIAIQDTGSNRIEGITLTDLLQRSGYKHKPNARIYTEAQRALQALAEAKYHMTATWRLPLEKKSVSQSETFSLLNRLSERHEQHDFNEAQSKRVFDIEVQQAVMDSINGPLTLALNMTVLSALTSPQARGLYRITESIRRDSNDPTVADERISLNVMELAGAMRLLTTRLEAARVIRNLSQKNGPLQQLISAGYLESFETVGRGDATTLHLKFNQAHGLFNQKVLQRLNELGIVGKNAQSLAVTVSLEEIDMGAKMVEEKEKKAQVSGKPVHSREGLLITLLRDGSARGRLLQQQRRQARIVQPASTQTTVEQLPADTQEQALKNIQSLRLLGRIKKEQEEQLINLIHEEKLSFSEIRRWLTLTGPELETELKVLIQ